MVPTRPRRGTTPRCPFCRCRSRTPTTRSRRSSATVTAQAGRASRCCTSTAPGPKTGSIRVECPNRADDTTHLDCNHDDYFHAASPTGYLARHWNAANNRLLIGAASQPGDDKAKDKKDKKDKKSKKKHKSGKGKRR